MDKHNKLLISGAVAMIVAIIFAFLGRFPLPYFDSEAEIEENRKWLPASQSKMAGRIEGLSLSDPNSFSRPDECVVNSIHMVVDVNFTNSLLQGYVDLYVERKKPDVSHLILDARDLTIDSVTDAKTNAALNFELDKPVLTFGSKLSIKLPEDTNTQYLVRVKYSTSSKSSALQWLPPVQTAGKKYPFMFSQCQAIHARSMLPCQDTPGVKTPFTAEISAPKELTVLMGALHEGVKPHPSDATKSVSKFKQPVPIPSYLIAIVVGALESRTIGPRSKVWSEKEFIEKSAYEFAETESMLQAAESIAGPYVWGQYDILVLPPSFPFGGMENPCLTFVTPTLLAGDRSLASVVAHEIAHSWTGNLVTNKNFEHFWLNEGFTVFLERKIVGVLYGHHQRHFHAIGGWKELIEAVNAFGNASEFTKLVPNLKGVDPDDSFSSVPYEKGHAFLFYLEQKIGSEAKFDEFLRSYIKKYSYQSIDTDEWKKYLLEYFSNKNDGSEELFSDVDWHNWLYGPGMPPVELQFDTTLAEKCTRLKNRWVNATNLEDFSADDLEKMSSLQICEFLSQLLLLKEFPVEKMKAMEKHYQLNSKNNCEIKFRWLKLGIKNHWEDAIPLALKFVSEQGRMKYVRPLFRELYAWDISRPKAIDTYNKISSEMMYVTSTMVAKDLHLEK